MIFDNIEISKIVEKFSNTINSFLVVNKTKSKEDSDKFISDSIDLKQALNIIESKINDNNIVLTERDKNIVRDNKLHFTVFKDNDNNRYILFSHSCETVDKVTRTKHVLGYSCHNTYTYKPNRSYEQFLLDSGFIKGSIDWDNDDVDLEDSDYEN